MFELDPQHIVLVQDKNHSYNESYTLPEGMAQSIQNKSIFKSEIKKKEID